MKKSIILFAILGIILPGAVTKAQTLTSKIVDGGGSGPYKAIVCMEATLPQFTVYRPQDLRAAVKKEKKLPVIVFGNGGCRNANSDYENYLNEISSWGYVIIAIGPYSEFQDKMAWQHVEGTDASRMKEGIDWIFESSQARRSEYRKMIDLKKVFVMGQSCGGLQALTNAVDPRVRGAVILNSGIFKEGGSASPNPVFSSLAEMLEKGEKPDLKAILGPDAPDLSLEEMKSILSSIQESPSSQNAGLGGTMGKDGLKNLHTPLLYITGGPEDMAFVNAEDDFALITHVPVFKADVPIGHAGDYDVAGGGEVAPVALLWLEWQAKGRRSASRFFLDENYRRTHYPRWTLKSRNLKQIVPER